MTMKALLMLAACVLTLACGGAEETSQPPAAEG